MQVGEEVHDLVATARSRYEWAGEMVQEMRERGLFIEELEGRLEEANTGLQQLVRDQHILEPQQVEQETVVVEAVADEVFYTLGEVKAQLWMRRMFVIPLWAYVGLMVLLLYWKRRRIERR